MKKNLLFSFLVLISSSLLAQVTKQDLAPCGTVDYKSDWLRRYQQQPQAYERGEGQLLHLPLSVHVLGSNVGAGHFSVNNLLNALCRLNQDFEATEIQFFLNSYFNYINNSDWNNHATVIEGAAMMFENNIANTINNYIVSDPAGNCGYNLPYAGIAVAKSCASASDHTWAHEVGHNLSLPHPFLGWEGGVGFSGETTHNYNNPAPSQVLYDYTYFKDTLIIDTMIIDTALVELVDGSNCHLAADGFCDTAPDYLGFRWQCNGNGVSGTEQTDPDGLKFRSDGSLFMCYSDDNCQTRFSDDQIAAMRANLFDEKPELISDEPPLDLINDEVVMLSPASDAMVGHLNVLIEWEDVPYATHYILQVSRIITFGFSEEYIVEGNSHIIDSLQADKTYHWRVRPFNFYSFCAPFSETRSFETAVLSSNPSILDIEIIKLQPNLISATEPVQLQVKSSQQLDINIEILNTSRQILYQKHLEIGTGNFFLDLPTEGLNAGMYWVRVNTEKGSVLKKLVVY